MMVPGSIIEALGQAIGLEVDSIGIGALEAALYRQLARHAGLTLAEYEHACRADRSVLEGLIEEVVVGETWFFRDRAPFAFLAEWAARALPARGPLSMLSLPCSSGEEAYSIAITLLDAGLEPSQFTIDAVDVSQRALARARTARYGSGSFRGGCPEGLERHFQVEAEERIVPDAIRRLVCLRAGNILDLGCWEPASTRPAARAAPGSNRTYDVVFCRNLLIYLDRGSRATAIRNLERLVAPGGLLVVGHTEGSLPNRSRFQPVGGAATFAFERRDSNQQAPAAIPAARHSAKQLEPTFDPPPPATPAVPVSPTSDPAARAGEILGGSLAPAIEAANAGRLAWAADFCLEHIDRRGPSVEALHLLGVVHSAQGAVEAAEADFRRALYLNADHYESLTQLALLRARQGDRVGAANLARRAARVHARRGEES